MSDSIKVYIRFRNNQTDGQNAVKAVSASQVRVHSSQMEGRNQKPVDYSFDRVYMKDSTQKAVYSEVGRPLLKNILAGYNSTLFVYGQTGSGKTYTMFGPDGGQMNDPEMQGIVPRQLRDLFSECKAREEKSGGKVQYETTVSIVDVYMERVRDLLNKDCTKQGSQASNCKVRYVKKHGVHMTYQNGDAIIEHSVNSYEDVLANINRALKIRKNSGAQKATKMNPYSSRSHFVVQLKLKETTPEGIKTSKLLLCDLAGSEKVKNTGASGKTLKQAQNINYGLSVLGNVLNALTARRKRLPPFKDSKLTKILQDALGGNSKTSLICGCRPDEAFSEETRSCLRFGANAKKIKNTVKPNITLTPEQYEKKTNRLQNQVDSAMEELRMSEAKAVAFQNWASALEEVATENQIDIKEIAEKKNLATVEEIVKKTTKVRSANGGDTSCSETEEKQNDFSSSLFRTPSMGPMAGGASKNNASSRFHREVNARLTVRCQNLEEDIADLRNRLKAQQMRIHHIEGTNDDLHYQREQWLERESNYKNMQGELYLTKNALHEQRKKNTHLEQLLEQTRKSTQMTNLSELLSVETNVEDVTKDIFAALRTNNIEQVNEIVVDQLRELSRVRKELENQKQMNQSLVEMRGHARKARAAQDRDILGIYTKAKMDKSKHDSELKKRDDTIERLRKQVEEVTEQRDLMRARLNVSGKGLSIGKVIKKRMPFQKLMNASDVSSKLTKRFADKKKRRRRKVAPKPIVLPVMSGESPVKGMTSPSA